MRKKVFLKENGKREKRKRIAVVSLFFVVCFSFLTYRCLHLHLAHDPKLDRIARSQYKTRIEEAPPRGNIYDATGEELAISVPAYSVAVRPSKMETDPTGDGLEELSNILGLSTKELASKLNAEKNYVWLKRHVAPAERDRLQKISMRGIELVKGARRFYPNREVASQILGAVGVDNEGLGGIELFYDRTLKGVHAESVSYRDARGKMFETEETLAEGAEDTHHLHLTIRKNIQYAAEKALNEACRQTQAKSCTAVVLDPHSGAVLAMASAPSFNPNSYQSYDTGLWRNLAVTDSFEPGSTYKPVLAAAALENGAVKPDDRFFCENGALKVGDHVIHDHEKYGMLSVREILKVSSNIGIYKVGRKLGRAGFARTIHLFGFGQKTGIDYPGEVAGFVPPSKSWQEIEFANISFGQGVRVTPLQLASSYATIANEGVRYRPYLVSHVTDLRGVPFLEIKPKPVERVLSVETARILLDMLKGVTEEGGTATKAALPGYEVAGKTGTAQKVIDGKYSHTKFVSSFVGMVPADRPELVVLVSVDEPKGAAYGGLVAAPVFKKIAWAALVDLGIPPQKSQGPLPAARRSLPLVTEARPLLREASFIAPGPSNDLREGSPDFRGLSKRKVLSFLEEHRLPCDVIGSGVAVSQEFRGDGRQRICRIYFRPD